MYDATHYNLNFYNALSYAANNPYAAVRLSKLYDRGYIRGLLFRGATLNKVQAIKDSAFYKKYKSDLSYMLHAGTRIVHIKHRSKFINNFDKYAAYYYSIFNLDMYDITLLRSYGFIMMPNNRMDDSVFSSIVNSNLHKVYTSYNRVLIIDMRCECIKRQCAPQNCKVPNRKVNPHLLWTRHYRFDIDSVLNISPKVKHVLRNNSVCRMYEWDTDPKDYLIDNTTHQFRQSADYSVNSYMKLYIHYIKHSSIIRDFRGIIHIMRNLYRSNPDVRHAITDDLVSFIEDSHVDELAEIILFIYNKSIDLCDEYTFNKLTRYLDCNNNSDVASLVRITLNEYVRNESGYHDVSGVCSDYYSPAHIDMLNKSVMRYITTSLLFKIAVYCTDDQQFSDLMDISTARAGIDSCMHALDFPRGKIFDSLLPSRISSIAKWLKLEHASNDESDRFEYFMKLFISVPCNDTFRHMVVAGIKWKIEKFVELTMSTIKKLKSTERIKWFITFINLSAVSRYVYDNDAYGRTECVASIIKYCNIIIDDHCLHNKPLTIPLHEMMNNITRLVEYNDIYNSIHPYIYPYLDFKNYWGDKFSRDNSLYAIKKNLAYLLEPRHIDMMAQMQCVYSAQYKELADVLRDIASEYTDADHLKRINNTINYLENFANGNYERL